MRVLSHGLGPVAQGPFCLQEGPLPPSFTSLLGGDISPFSGPGLLNTLNCTNESKTEADNRLQMSVVNGLRIPMSPNASPQGEAKRSLDPREEIISQQALDRWG